MSTLRVNTLQNAAGTGQPAMSGAAKAWVNFNGTGTVAIRASFNVTSITDNGTGDYTVNFTNALEDANYCVVTGGTRSDGLQSTILGLITTTAPSTTVARVFNKDDGGTANDALYACISIFR
jgi:hypothetical protein